MPFLKPGVRLVHPCGHSVLLSNPEQQLNVASFQQFGVGCINSMLPFSIYNYVHDSLYVLPCRAIKGSLRCLFYMYQVLANGLFECERFIL